MSKASPSTRVTRSTLQASSQQSIKREPLLEPAFKAIFSHYAALLRIHITPNHLYIKSATACPRFGKQRGRIPHTYIYSSRPRRPQMSLARSAANKLDWAKVISSLKITGKTAAQLSNFKRRNDEARRILFELEQQPDTVDFDYYRSKLNNKAIVDKIESYYKSYKPVTIDASKQIKTIEAFETHAMANAKETESLVASELAALNETLKNIQSAKPFDELTVDELVKARPDIDAKVEEMVKKGKWEVPGYHEKFGSLNIM